MVSRYDVANLIKENWPLLCWKGDEHTKGVYFDEEYGYLIERTYAVRIRHGEAAPPVFYIPNMDEPSEEEVTTDFPYKNLTKITKNYHLLYQEEALEEAQLNSLFMVDSLYQLILPAAPLSRLLAEVKNKRERDRSWLRLTIKGNMTEATVMAKQKEEALFSERFEISAEIGCNEQKNAIDMYLNANTLLHALNLFYCAGNIFFFICHDRIKITSYASTPKVEAVISISKHTPSTDILGAPG